MNFAECWIHVDVDEERPIKKLLNTFYKRFCPTRDTLHCKNFTELHSTGDNLT
jgi:hypothetical protein